MLNLLNNADNINIFKFIRMILDRNLSSCRIYFLYGMLKVVHNNYISDRVSSVCDEYLIKIPAHLYTNVKILIFNIRE